MQRHCPRAEASGARMPEGLTGEEGGGNAPGGVSEEPSIVSKLGVRSSSELDARTGRQHADDPRFMWAGAGAGGCPS